MRYAMAPVVFVCALCSAALAEKAPAAPRLTPVPLSISGTDQPAMRLDGEWQFHPSPPEAFWKPTTTPGTGWTPIQVPGEWAMQGFDVAPDTAAGYRRSFAVPENWAGKRVKVRFDAVYSDATVWVNGQRAGQHEGGFTPFELDLTPMLRYGEDNLIALAVKNESLADTLASGTQYATHPLGGITRKVVLFAVPELNLASIHIETVFDPDYRDATLRVCFTVANDGAAPSETAAVRFVLQDPGGEAVTLNPDSVPLPGMAPATAARQVAEIPVPVPQQWDAEHPRLYTLTCRTERSGQVLETVQRRVGFRQIEVRGTRLFVNNRAVKLRGICRHETHPLRGRSLTPALWRQDAELFRAANVNYIRTAHYPPAEEFIAACDELGLFVEEEAPLCWVGHGSNAAWKESDPQDPALRDLIVRQSLEMIERDRSHPSVLFWSLANESYWGANFEASLARARAADPTRPFTFHDQAWGLYNNKGSVADIANYHYPWPKDADRGDRLERPMLFGEYCHLNAYNREEIATDPGLRDAWGPGFAAMWEALYASEDCLGGAIWSGIDDIFHLPTGKSVGYGSWGPLDGWRRKKPEYWHIKKVYSPIRVLDRSVARPAAGEAIRIRVENRYDFTDLRDVRIAWTLGAASGTVATGVPPHTKGEIVLEPGAPQADGDALLLQFWDARGGLIDTERLPLRPAVEAVAETRTQGDLQLTQSDSALTVRGDGFAYAFDPASGLLLYADIGGVRVLEGGPVLMLLPLKGGECATDHRADIPPFNEVCHDWTPRKVVSTTAADGGVAVVVEGRYREASGTYRMQVAPDGGLSVAYRFTANEEGNPRQIGVVFWVSKDCDRLHWRRKAQWTAYPEDHIGRPEGSAQAFPDGPSGADTPRAAPSWAWALDRNALGTNDFRSSREHIEHAALTAATGAGVQVASNGQQTVRAFVDGKRIGWLIAVYSNGGAEPFFKPHLVQDYRPIERHDVIKDTVSLTLLAPRL